LAGGETEPANQVAMGSWEENVLAGVYSDPIPVSRDDDYYEEDEIDEEF